MNIANFKRNLNRRGKSVTLQARAMSTINGRVSEVFTDIATVTGLMSTLKGVKVFDSTNTERVATHKICLLYRAGVTAEQWVHLGSKRIKILTVENYCEADLILVLMCTERGDDSKVVNTT